jgi:hypothetical protein
MPQWLKVLLILIVTGILGLGVLVGGCVYWFNANRDKLASQGRAAQTEGTAFGRAHAKGDCIEDGFTRLKSCGPVDFMCEAMLKMRLTSCMSVAAEDGACRRVPLQKDILKEAFWGNEECKRRGQAGSQPCSRYLQGVAAACAGEER